MYPYIDLFGRQISTYALLVIAGLLTCGFVASFLGKKRGVEYESVIFMILSVSLGMFIGAHIVFAFTNMPQIIELFSKIGSISAGDFFTALGTYVGGMVFYGGFFGAVAAVAIYSKFSKAVARPVAMDLLSICIPLFHIFGRVGCFLTGCCYGFASESGLPTHHYIGEELYIVNRFPVQLVEAAGNLLIFFIIMYLYRKGQTPSCVYRDVCTHAICSRILPRRYYPRIYFRTFHISVYQRYSFRHSNRILCMQADYQKN